MEISVIICTYNRCESLRRTLTSLCDVLVPEKLQWELLVMDNNSRDLTPQVCAEFVGKIPIRYIHEPRQGKSYALNHGIDEARGELLLFTDDDVDFDPHWLAIYAEAARRNPTFEYFGGRVIPRWEQPPPRWVEENSQTLLRAMVVHWDLGETERTLLNTNLNEGFIGANMGVRAALFATAGKFQHNLGTTERGSEDGEFNDRLRRGGWGGVYLPRALIYHRNPPNRMTERYLRHVNRVYGITLVRTGELSQEHLWFSVPSYVWRQLFSGGVQYALFRWTRPTPVWVAAAQRMAKAWGTIQESWRQARQRK